MESEHQGQEDGGPPPARGGRAGCDQRSALGGARLSVAWGDPEQGHALIRAYGCGTCHTIGGIPGADQHVGPPLTGIAERTYIAGALYNTTGNLIRWIMDPQEVDPGTAMPDLGISESEARNIAAYLAGEPVQAAPRSESRRQDR